MSVEDPHSFSDFTQGLIQHINFEIEVNFVSHTLGILANYHLDRPVTGSFFLDTRDLQIKRISQDGKNVEWELDMEDDILGQRLHLHELDQVSEFSIQLKTSPGASALQWLQPTQTAGGLHPFLYSQCQMLHARSIFPCQDSPSVRFTYNATIKAPEALKAVMAAESMGDMREGGSTVSSFHMPQPIPSYLFALAIGELVFQEVGPRTGIYAEPSIIDAAVWEFEENEEKLIQAEKLLGPYLWDRYDLLIMPSAFPPGGMENPRLTFLHPSTIIGDRSGTSIVTHELAHAWTGNLVTNATWEDFWLNEGWTTYAELRITELLEGKDVEQLIWHLKRTAMHDAMANFGYESRFTCLSYSQEGVDPDIVFSSIPYAKGAAFLVCLEEAAGRDVFDAFIKHYIETYQFTSITTDEFIAFLLENLPEAAERVDIEEWVYRPGFPESAPQLSSKLYDEVESAISAFTKGILPEKKTVKNWRALQVIQFCLDLQNQEVTIADCKYFEDLFGIDDSASAGLRRAFYLFAIPAGYEDIRPGIERYVEQVGRSFFLMSLYRCMVKVDWTREFARSLFEENRHRHHPITVKSNDAILTEAGL